MNELEIKRPEWRGVPEDPGRALEALADLFRSTHWGQGRFSKIKGDKVCYCLIGGARFVTAGKSYAVTDNMPGGKLYRQVLTMLRAALAAERPTPIADAAEDEAQSVARAHDLVTWNDEPGRTAAEVVELVQNARLIYLETSSGPPGMAS